MSEYGASGLDDLVTGEAVALDLPPAGLGMRILAGLVDIAVTGIALLVVAFTMLTATVSTDEALSAAAFTLSLAFVLIGIPAGSETLSRGKTLGKWIFGLRAVRDDAGPITFQHAFTRALVGVVEIYLLSGMPAFFAALFNSRGKRLGDHAAGTYVVRERVKVKLPPAAPMPPHLATWAASADLGRLPTGLALAVRRYLAGDRTTPSPARLAVGTRLADQVSSYVAPLPPPGAAVDDFLAAVIAGRRDRDALRLAREAELRRRLTGH